MRKKTKIQNIHKYFVYIRCTIFTWRYIQNTHAYTRGVDLSEHGNGTAREALETESRFRRIARRAKLNVNGDVRGHLLPPRAAHHRRACSRPQPPPPLTPTRLLRYSALAHSNNNVIILLCIITTIKYTCILKNN